MHIHFDYRPALVAAIVLVLTACSGGSQSPATPATQATAAVGDPLRTVASFASISDKMQRSTALFTEIARVLQSPRCLNCHPATRMPTQGEDLHAHIPPIQAGAADHGPSGLACNTCHQAENVLTHVTSIASVPGNVRWALAPESMAWQGKTVGEICVQIKDPARNGGHSLEQIHKHMAEDPLVGWAWHPGPDRKPAPGTQQHLGELLAAWIADGASCPGS